MSYYQKNFSGLTFHGGEFHLHFHSNGDYTLHLRNTETGYITPEPLHTTDFPETMQKYVEKRLGYAIPDIPESPYFIEREQAKMKNLGKWKRKRLENWKQRKNKNG